MNEAVVVNVTGYHNRYVGHGTPQNRQCFDEGKAVPQRDHVTER